MVPEKTFKKEERLSLDSRIKILFNSGAAIHSSPVKILWLTSGEPLEYPAQALFTVSAKRFKKAVDRNRIKRKLKEAYRQQKAWLYRELKRLDRVVLIGILYTGNDPDPEAGILAEKLAHGLEKMLRP